MKKYIIALIFIAIFSCQSGKDSSTSKLNSYLDGFSNLEFVEHVLVLPATVSCQYCATKVYEFIERLELPENTLFVLTGSYENEIRKISNSYSIEEGSQIKFDLDNYFFKEQLVFVNPVLFSKNEKEWISTEMVPINVNQELEKLFGFGACNEKIIKNIWPLEFRGTVKKIDFTEDQINLTVRNFEDLNNDTVFFLSKGSMDYFNGNVEEGTLMQKEKFSLDYYLITLIDSMSATVKKQELRCD
jgi:hypothetical protein